jgi:hypothetical protein
LITSNCLSEHQIIAVVDFLYQHGKNSSNVRLNANKCSINQIYWMFTWWRDRYNGKIAINGKYIYQPWMRDREQRRINYFYKN